MSLVRLIELQLGSLADRFCEGQAGGNDQYIVVVSSDGVFLRQLRSHLGLVFIGPRHQKNGSRTMLDNGVAVLLRVFVKNALQLRMNGTLTAVRQDDGVERLVEF